MTKQEAIWHANHVFNLVIERCLNAQNLKDAREFDEAKQIVIEALEQEPKRGKWIDKGDFYVCSECGNRMTYAVLGSEFSRAYAFMSDYCPHCGSPMEVESDEE